MQIFDIKEISNNQEVPKVNFRPLKETESGIFFEKYVTSIEDSWVEGIFFYDKNLKELKKIEFGDSVNPFKEIIEIPGTYEDIVAMESMDSFYYAVIKEDKKEALIDIYKMELDGFEQERVLSFSYDTEEFYYKGLELINDEYLIFGLGDEETEPLATGEADLAYLVDVNERKIYEILDKRFIMTSGMRMVFKKDGEDYLMIEERYLEDEEKEQLLKDPEIELAVSYPEEFGDDFVFRNSINLISVSDFVNQIKEEKDKIEYEVVESIGEEGSIKVLGSTDQKIFYKKKTFSGPKDKFKTLFELRNQEKDLIYSIDIFNREVKFERELSPYSILTFDKDKAYEIKDEMSKIQVLDFPSSEKIFTYKKKIKLHQESFYEINGKCLFVLKTLMKSPKGPSFIEIIDMEDSGHKIIRENIFIVGNTLFLD